MEKNSFLKSMGMVLFILVMQIFLFKVSAQRYPLKSAVTVKTNTSPKQKPEQKKNGSGEGEGVSDDEVTLVVVGSAPTEQEATLVALRSAIEQTYGTFVSANTTILNDELVKDEIVSVSKGNVKHYDKLAVNILPNGQTSVSLKATISISKLRSFAKSKGASAEFEGQTFAMNIKLKELRAKNTFAAYQNMCLQVTQLLNDAFDYKIEIGNPYIGEKPLYRVTQYKDGVDVVRDWVYDKKGYIIPITIKILATAKTSQIYSLVQNTIDALKLNEEELRDYNAVRMYPYRYERPSSGLNKVDVCYLPVSEKDKNAIQQMDSELSRKIVASLMGHKIVDIANPSYCLRWQKGLNNCKYTYTRPALDLNAGRYLWLVDTNREAMKAFELEDNGSIYDGSYEKIGGYRIDKFNWSAWMLPIKNKKKQEYEDVKQVIFNYYFLMFMPKEKMDSFKGFSSERDPSLRLP